MDKIRLRELIIQSCPEIPDDVQTMALSGNFLRTRIARTLSNNTVPFELTAALEMAHTASLLHDDVLDNELIRRGNTSVNRTWGNKASILYGDILLAAATRLTASNGDNNILLRFMQSIQDTCRGELEQQRFSTENCPTVERYFENARAKTGSFFGYAAFCGATFSAAKKNSGTYADLFTDLGGCYQLLDDLKDSISTGRQRTDTENGTINFPLALLDSTRRKAILESDDIITAPLKDAIKKGSAYVSERYAELKERLLQMNCNTEILETTDGLFQ